jgi:hypothetical protein
MSAAIAASIGLLVALAAACLGINVYLLLTKQIADPHEVVALAKSGHRLARVYVALFVLALVVFGMQIALLVLRGLRAPCAQGSCSFGATKGRTSMPQLSLPSARVATPNPSLQRTASGVR